MTNRSRIRPSSDWFRQVPSSFGIQSHRNVIATKASEEIAASPFGDYPYRVFVEPAVFTEWIADQANRIDYSNFKSHMSLTRGLDYQDALHDVWVAMLKTSDD